MLWFRLTPSGRDEHATNDARASQRIEALQRDQSHALAALDRELELYQLLPRTQKDHPT